MLTRIFAVLAVAALVACAFLWMGRTAADARADAAEQRARALQGEIAALKEAGKRDDVAAEATTVARKAADARQPIQEARAARVRGYADSAGDTCKPDPRIVRELADGADRVRAATGRLRGQ